MLMMIIMQMKVSHVQRELGVRVKYATRLIKQ